MKNKIVTIILGIALLLSVGGNIYLVKTMTDTNKKVNTLSGQLVTADNEIADLQEQLTDISALQAEVNDLQGQLTQSNTQIESLETTITENNATISDLEEQLAERDNQQNIQSEAETVEQTQNGNDDSEPIATPENAPTDNVSNQGDGRSDDINPPLVTEPDGSVHPQIGHRYDDNDPSFPIYEGDKRDQGLAWSNSMGYIPWNGGTGTTQTGEDMPEWTPCVYDENGNCTIHQHYGE